jgi:outer membrane protein assembly factor BamB
MQRGVLVVSVIVIIGTLAYLATRPIPAPQGSTPNSVQIGVAAPTTHAFGPTFAESDPKTSTSSPGNWVMEGSNPARTRVTSAILTLPLDQQRAIGISDADESASPPVISQGILLSESSYNLRAFDLATGQQRWVFAEPGTYVSPAVAGERVFIRSESDNKGKIYALELKTGAKIWEFTPKRISAASNGYYGGHLTSPVVVDGVVFVGAGKEVYALDAATGQQRWMFSLQDYITCSATVAHGQVYISDFRYVYAIDQQSGTLRWSFPVQTAFSFSAVASDASVLVTNGDNLTALDTATGKKQWELSIPGEVLIPAAADNSRAYVKSTQSLYAIDLSTGKELWRYRDDEYVSLPVVAGNHLVIISGMGANTAINALATDTGASVWRKPTSKLSTSAPVIAGQTMYIRATDGRVFAFSS